MDFRKIDISREKPQQSGEKKPRAPHFFSSSSPEGFSASSTSVHHLDQRDREKRINAHYESGERYRQAGRYQEAINELNQLFGLDEQNTFAFVSRGKTYEAMGKPKEASADYEKALTLNPSLAEVRAALDKICRQLPDVGLTQRIPELRSPERPQATTSPGESSSYRGAAESRPSESREINSSEERLQLERERKAMQEERLQLERERKAIHDERLQLEHLRINSATRSSAEASSSRRSGEFRSPERPRPTDRRPDSGRSDGEHRVERRLGDYRLKDVLGEGSFAKVYLGEPVDPTKPPAAVKMFKMPLIGPITDLFFNEVKTLQKLHHENIVRIYDFGVKDLYPYLAMEVARSGPLDQVHPRGTRLSSLQASTYLDQIGPALDYAHSQKIVHRDLKPANILLGEKPNGVQKILLADFGLAKVFQNSTSRKTQEEIVGTLAYIAPEQIKGKPGPQSDLYSIGVMLYQWESGRLPFRGTTIPEIIAQHLEAPPEPIPGISEAIQNVIFRALQKDPKKRFQSGTELAQAYRYACGVPSLGKREAACSSSTGREGTNPQNLGERNALATRDQMAIRRQDITDLQVIRNPERLTLIRTLTGYTCRVKSVALSADGKTLVSVEDDASDRAIKIWDMRTGKLFRMFPGHRRRDSNGYETNNTLVALSKDGQILVSGGGGSDGDCWNNYEPQTWTSEKAWVWEVRTGNLRRLLPSKNPLLSLVLSGDGRTLVGVDTFRNIKIWDVRTGDYPPYHSGSCHHKGPLALSKNGRILVIGGERGCALEIWDVRTKKLLRTVADEGVSWVTSVALSSDGKTAVSGSHDSKTVKIWEVQTGQLRGTLAGHTDFVTSVALSSDGKTVVSGSHDKTVKIWEVK